MISQSNELKDQIERIKKAMMLAGVWSTEIPSWLDHYQLDQIPNIWEWLQYIYLPMRLNGDWFKPHYIAPVLSPYMNTTPELLQILKLVIELDSMSSTLEKT